MKRQQTNNPLRAGKSMHNPSAATPSDSDSDDDLFAPGACVARDERRASTAATGGKAKAVHRDQTVPVLSDSDSDDDSDDGFVLYGQKQTMNAAPSRPALAPTASCDVVPMEDDSEDDACFQFKEVQPVDSAQDRLQQASLDDASRQEEIVNAQRALKTSIRVMSNCHNQPQRKKRCKQIQPSAVAGYAIKGGVLHTPNDNRQPIRRQVYDAHVRVNDVHGSSRWDKVRIINHVNDPPETLPNGKKKQPKKKRPSRAANPFDPSYDHAKRLNDEMLRKYSEQWTDPNVTYELVTEGDADAGPTDGIDAVTSSSAAHSLLRASGRNIDERGNHVDRLKVAYQCRLPSCCIHRFSNTHIAPLMEMRMRVLFKSSSASQAMTYRGPTDGSGMQTTRILVTSGACQIKDMFMVSYTQAMAKYMMERAIQDGQVDGVRPDGVKLRVRDAYDLHSMDPCEVFDVLARTDAQAKLCATIMADTTSVFYGEGACRMRDGGLLQEARRLAVAELDPRQRLISSTFGDMTQTLHLLCLSVIASDQASMKAIGHSGEIVFNEDDLFDCMWSSIVLIIYVWLDHRGRRLIDPSVTDLDLSIMRAFDEFGFGEVRRRVRYHDKRTDVISNITSGNEEARNLARGAGEDIDSSDEECDTPKKAPAKRAKPSTSEVGDEDVETSRAGNKNANISDPSEYLYAWHRFLNSRYAAVLHTAMAATQHRNEEGAWQSMQQQLCTEVGQYDDSRRDSSVNYARMLSRWSLALLDPQEHGIARLSIQASQRKVLDSGNAQEGSQLVLDTGFDDPSKCIGNRRLHYVDVPQHMTSSTPPKSTGIAFLWSQGCVGLDWCNISGEYTDCDDPSDKDRRMSYYARVSALQHAANLSHQHADDDPARDLLVRCIMEHQDPNNEPMHCARTGVYTTWAVFKTNFTYVPTDVKCASVVCRQALDELRKVLSAPELKESCHSLRRNNRSFLPVSLHNELLKPLGADERQLTEPMSTPSEAYAAGIRIASLLVQFTMGQRAQKIGKTTGYSPCLYQVLNDNKTQLRSLHPQGDSKPVPVAIPVDIKMKQRSEHTATDVPMTVSVQFVGHELRRLSDVCRSLYRDRSVDIAQRNAKINHVLAMYLAGTAQCLYVMDISYYLSWVNLSSTTRATKRQAITDVTLMGFLTVDQVLVGRRGNMSSVARNLPWVSQTGSGFDCGTTPAGVDAANKESDGRKHGVVCISENVSNVLLKLMVSEILVELPQAGRDGAKQFAIRPNDMRGIPKMLLRGISAGCKTVDDALEHVRSVLGTGKSPYRVRDANVTGDDLVWDLLVNTVTPYAQQPAPDCRPGSGDPSSHARFGRQRHESGDPLVADYSTIGRQAIIDRTFDHRSVGTGTTRMPRPSACNRDDNYYSYPMEEPALLFSMFSLIARLSELDVERSYESADDAKAAVDKLFETVDHFVHDEETNDACNYKTAALTLLALGVCYPCTFGISEPMLPRWMSKLVPACMAHQPLGACANTLSQLSARREGATETGSVECDELMKEHNLPIPPSKAGAWPIITDQELTECKDWWMRFARPHKGAWKEAIAPFLVDLVQRDGTHDVDQAMIDRTRTHLDECICAAWLVHSDDGNKPPSEHVPCHDAPDWMFVGRQHVCPIFGDKHGETARGGVVGMPLHQAQGLMVQAFSNICPFVQSYRLVGQMAHRIAFDACVFDNGAPRTMRSTNPTAQDQCQLAHGILEERMVSCHRQRNAWDLNILVQMPLFVELVPPHPKERRFRGARGTSHVVNQSVLSSRNPHDSSSMKNRDEVDAFKAMRSTKDILSQMPLY